MKNKSVYLVILLTVLLPLQTFAAEKKNKYQELLNAGKKYELQQDYVYALNYYWDAMEYGYQENKTEACESFDQLAEKIRKGFSDEIKSSKLVSDSSQINPFWKKQLYSFNQYYTKNTPFIFVFSKPKIITKKSSNSSDLIFTCKTSTIPKYDEIKNILEEGFKKSSPDTESNITPFSINEPNFTDVKILDSNKNLIASSKHDSEKIRFSNLNDDALSILKSGKYVIKLEAENSETKLSVRQSGKKYKDLKNYYSLYKNPETDSAETEKFLAEQEKLAKEREAEKLRLEQERIAEEKEAERLRLEQERLAEEKEAERLEQERLAEVREAQRLKKEQEKLAREEKEKIWREQKSLAKEKEAKKEEMRQLFTNTIKPYLFESLRNTISITYINAHNDKLSYNGAGFTFTGSLIPFTFVQGEAFGGDLKIDGTLIKKNDSYNGGGLIHGGLGFYVPINKYIRPYFIFGSGLDSYSQHTSYKTFGVDFSYECLGLYIEYGWINNFMKNGTSRRFSIGGEVFFINNMMF